jgi:predicted DNA-binding protein (UPF0251 family)
VREAASLKKVVSLPGPDETLSFAPHTHLLASGTYSGVKLWSTETWQEVRSLTNAMLPSLFSPDGRWLLTGVAGAFRVWDTQTWQPVGDCPGAPQLAFNARNAVAFSPDSQFLVTISGKGWDLGDHLRVWRLPRLEEQLPEIRFESEPGSVAFTADGKHLVTGLWDGQVVVLDFQTRQRLPMPKQHTAWVTVIAVGPDGKSVAPRSAAARVSGLPPYVSGALAERENPGRIRPEQSGLALGSNHRSRSPAAWGPRVNCGRSSIFAWWHAAGHNLLQWRGAPLGIAFRHAASATQRPYTFQGEALDRLATVDLRAAAVVKLCFFVGLTQEQAARELDVSLSTAERLWSFARAWLFREMQKPRNTTV